MVKKKSKRKRTSLLQRSVMIILTFTGTLALLVSSIESSQTDEQSEGFAVDRTEFIQTVAAYAVPLQETHGIWPSITIAQAIVESNWGQSGLALNEQNYFGIKGSSSQPTYATLEYEDDWVEIQASFRSYDSLQESVEDYAELIAGGTNWNPDLYRPVIEADTYREAAYALKNSGYATDPTYPDKLIEIVELYNLDQYDR